MGLAGTLPACRADTLAITCGYVSLIRPSPLRLTDTKLGLGNWDKHKTIAPVCCTLQLLMRASRLSSRRHLNVYCAIWHLCGQEPLGVLYLGGVFLGGLVRGGGLLRKSLFCLGHHKARYRVSA